jgi:hypothetical protein
MVVSTAPTPAGDTIHLSTKSPDLATCRAGAPSVIVPNGCLLPSFGAGCLVDPRQSGNGAVGDDS